MDDLDLLKELPGRVDPPDEEAKRRMRALMRARMGTGSARRSRPVVKVGLLGIAAVLTAASLAAAIAIHPWTDDQPVTIGVGIYPAGSGSEGGTKVEISDPNGLLTTPADLTAAVAEFAPAIRLPEGGTFDMWTQHVNTGETMTGHAAMGFETPIGTDRTSVVVGMVEVSQCQWAEQWLNASAQGDQAGAQQAVQILGGVGEWMQVAVSEDPAYLVDLLDQMKNGEKTGIQRFENGCAYMGSWGNTPAEQDAKATGDLTSAAQTAQDYLLSGGDAGAFDPSTAGLLAQNVEWTDSTMQPVPALPGAIFIARSGGAGVTLVSVSEAGTQFCAVITDTEVVHGTTTHDLNVVPNLLPDGSTGAKAADPSPVDCTPGGW